MGFSGISPMSLLLILLIVVCLFGTKRLRSLGSDLGAAVKSFRNSLNETSNTASQTTKHELESDMNNQNNKQE
ncbi:MAG: Sec-independent protein translocase subunit TatA [Gammaproteobacteria bacterium]